MYICTPKLKKFISHRMNWIKRFSKNPAKPLTEKNSENEEISTMECRNCETKFKGKYCPNCGQILKEFDKPFSILIYDFMGTVFAFDARFFKTIKSVVLRPGKFSFDYMNGKRASYMKPFQFYVFISFVFFLLLSIQTNRFIDLEKDKPVSTLQDTLKLDELIPDLAKMPLSENGIADSLMKDYSKSLVPQRNRQLISYQDLEKAKLHLQSQLDEKQHSEMEKLLLQNTIKMLSYPDIFISKLYKYISWSFFMVMPLFAFWLWLFFRKKRRYYSGHFIYSLNAHATTFLIFALIISVKLLFPHKESSFENYLFWLIPIYVWLGMKKFYNQTILKTTFKFLLLSFIYSFSIVITVAFVFIISLYYV